MVVTEEMELQAHLRPFRPLQVLKLDLLHIFPLGVLFQRDLVGQDMKSHVEGN